MNAEPVKLHSIRALGFVRMMEIERERSPDMLALDAIVRIDSIITEMELHLAKRKAPFDAAELALFTRLERILKKAKEIYCAT